MVSLLTLDQSFGVRIPVSQPLINCDTTVYSIALFAIVT